MNVFERIREKVKDYLKDKIVKDGWDIVDFNADISNIIYQVEADYNNGWCDVDIEVPSASRYILLSFSNFSIPQIGRYEADEEGGAFYIGDDTETCVSQDLFVNAWMELPEPYKERDTDAEL